MASGFLACNEVVGRDVSQAGHLRVKEVAVYPEAFPRLLSRKKRGHDRAMRVQARRDVGSGYAYLARRTVRLTCTGPMSDVNAHANPEDVHVHESGLRLDDHVVAGRFGIRTSLPIS